MKRYAITFGLALGVLGIVTRAQTRTNLLTAAEAIKVASRLRVGMREKDATTLLERGGLTCNLPRAGDGFHWLNSCELGRSCSLDLEFTNSPGKVGHWEEGHLQRVYIASNGVTIV